LRAAPAQIRAVVWSWLEQIPFRAAVVVLCGVLAAIGAATTAAVLLSGHPAAHAAPSRPPPRQAVPGPSQQGAPGRPVQQPGADISAVLSCPAGLTVGGSGTCTLSVTNAGPGAARTVEAGVVLPAALSETSCTATCARHINLFTWTLAPLASGASAKLGLTVRASAASTVQVVAAAAAQNPDPHPLNDTSVQQITIAPDKQADN
jgi:hypothetical protein